MTFSKTIFYFLVLKFYIDCLRRYCKNAASLYNNGQYVSQITPTHWQFFMRWQRILATLWQACYRENSSLGTANFCNKHLSEGCQYTYDHLAESIACPVMHLAKGIGLSLEAFPWGLPHLHIGASFLKNLWRNCKPKKIQEAPIFIQTIRGSWPFFVLSIVSPIAHLNLVRQSL